MFGHSGIMTVFENCTVVLDVKNVPYKEKNKLRLALLENGGNISYVINKEVRIPQITWKWELPFMLYNA